MPDKLKSEFQPKAHPPSLTVYQLSILDAVSCAEIKGADLREALRQKGFENTPASFSGAMLRLERDGLVEGRYVVTQSGNTTIREKYFTITDDGCLAVSQFMDFVQGLHWNTQEKYLEP